MKVSSRLQLNKHEKLIKKSILAKTRKSAPREYTPEQLEHIRMTRSIKAERDERLDISQSLAPPKHYLGGFTVPKSLRSYNHQPGGSYEFKAPYEPPREDGYTPHEVVLFRTRWNLDKGPGIPVAPDHLVGTYPASRTAASILDLHRSLGVQEGDARDRKFWKLWQNTYADKVARETEGDVRNEEEDFYVGFRTLPQEDPALRVSGSLYLEEEMADKNHSDTPVHPPHAIPSAPYFAPLSITPTSTKEIPRPPPPTTIIYPLLRIVLPTRPLARVFARLSRALVTGMPYVGVIPLADRKDGKSVFRRITRLRLSRMRALLRDTAHRLEGLHGGFPGLRVTHTDRGKGYKGERLSEGFPEEFKQIKVLMRPGLLPMAEIDEWRTLPNVTIRWMDDLGRELTDDLKEVVESVSMEDIEQSQSFMNEEDDDSEHEKD
ncbi:hypothetical protein E3P99_03483 [Wallemia hederae]|uniref:Uncharacterized protein n=1 Tax=Wallemia hederae TaxID=1540922 RepID=A0A4T0FG35_9BASI|nr:hypothetical protein E3P99_03483 [Wallemia hederae]